MSSRLTLATVASMLALAPSRALHAQSAAPDSTGSVCLGFAFGTWTPKLDWRAAGHAPPPGTSQEQAPGGRDWASAPDAGTRDTTLLLYPRWWPAGVVVALPTRTPAPGDTVVGRAVALVPRADVEAPVSRVRAWRVPCRSS